MRKHKLFHYSFEQIPSMLLSSVTIWSLSASWVSSISNTFCRFRASIALGVRSYLQIWNRKMRGFQKVLGKVQLRPVFQWGPSSWNTLLPSSSFRAKLPVLFPSWQMTWEAVFSWDSREWEESPLPRQFSRLLYSLPFKYKLWDKTSLKGSWGSAVLPWSPRWASGWLIIAIFAPLMNSIKSRIVATPGQCRSCSCYSQLQL